VSIKGLNLKNQWLWFRCYCSLWYFNCCREPPFFCLDWMIIKRVKSFVSFYSN